MEPGLECGAIPSRWEEIIGYYFEEQGLPVCICKENHKGPHLFKYTEGVYVTWEYDDGCVCDSCLSEDSDDWCYVYSKLNESEAQEVLNRE